MKVLTIFSGMGGIKHQLLCELFATGQIERTHSSLNFESIVRNQKMKVLTIFSGIGESCNDGDGRRAAARLSYIPRLAAARRRTRFLSLFFVPLKNDEPF